ncbi:MAG: SIS domain-containing protein [Candidatus Tectomicrobia bacterium]|nr:SIS domain-containing protein [Candidatus Tectomicrobia bacterium]
MTVTIDGDVGGRVDKASYPHYTLKEIHEGADCIEKALAIPQADIVEMAKRIDASQRVFLTGMGTSYYVALTTQYYFANLADFYIPVTSADELPALAQLGPNDLTLAISQSGETHEILKALRYANQHGGQTAAIVNMPGSSIVREVDHIILQGAGPETCAISTKSTISQITILLRVAVELACLRGKCGDVVYAEHHQVLSELPEILREMYTSLVPTMRRLGHTYCHTPNWFFIGRGIYSAVALESAFKFKEVSYLHAEGMSGGFLKHGTIALIDDQTHSLAFIPSPEEHHLFNATLSNIQEIRARDGLVIGVHQLTDDGLQMPLDDAIVVPAAPALVTPLVHLTAGQMLAYYMALALERNIDKPRAPGGLTIRKSSIFPAAS